ncbi:MAG: SufD family Fe-S cluster assembly protein [Propionibacteriaceae bacterium]|nr:SufD family Fe-S cluster assembly protein [Propionibacteriaceae bacterium]
MSAPVIESHLHTRPSFDLADHPLPTGHEEIYRFAPMDRLAPLLDADADWVAGRVDVSAGPGVAVETVDAVAGLRDAGFVPVDRPSAIGAAMVAQATKVTLWPDTATPLRSAQHDGVGFSAQHGGVGVSAQHGGVGVSAQHDGINPLIVQPNPVILRTVAGSAPSSSAVIIEATPNSRGIVLIEHTGPGQFIGNMAVKLGEGADLTVVTLQEWDADALHAGLHQAVVGRDAHLRHIAVTFGGSLVRLQTNVSYDGPGGVAELFGLYLTDGHQYQEHRLFVDQNQPKTTSRVDYRGALQGQGARSAWVGDVLIRRNAEGTDSYEQNRNLLLTPGCVAESVPNLEIETGNIVGAGHSSATGRFDDEQLFYLQSRGIPENEARRLIVQGFFFDIIARIGVPDVERRLRDAVNAELKYQPEED